MTNQHILQRGAAPHRPARLFWQAGLLLLAATAACGQPRAAAGSAPGKAAVRPFTVTPVAKFSTPWALDFLPTGGGQPAGQALLTEKEGTLWLVNMATGAKRKIEGLPKLRVAGQGGLGDVVVHPGFKSNRRVYLTFVEAGAGGSGAALGYGTLAVDKGAPRLTGFRTIWRQSPKLAGNGHFSHRIAFAPDGTLYLSSGDRQEGDPAQALDGNLGKVLHLTGEGVPVAGGPFARQSAIAAQFHSIGHRNILGLAFAPDGRLWATEMGPEGGDELNLILGGRNYGWPRASNGSDYGGGEIADHRSGDGFEPPKLSWNPSISPGGLLIYSGTKFPGWKGDALIPALSGKALIRVDLEGDRATKAEQWAMDARIRAVDEAPDGTVYLIEDKGRLVRLDRAK